MRGSWIAIFSVAFVAFGCGTLLSLGDDPGPDPPSDASVDGTVDGGTNSDPTLDGGEAARDADAAKDSGCDAATSCATNQCGTAPNGCGGKIVCAPCEGRSACDVDAGVCVACTYQGPGCPTTANTKCPANVSGNQYACEIAPTNGTCTYCPNPTTGKGLLYCCP